VPQVGTLNPYLRVEAETTKAQSGIETEACSDGGMDVTSIADGDWVSVRGVDFGAGAKTFSARVASSTAQGAIEVRAGSSTGTVLATCDVPVTGGLQKWQTTSCSVSGATGIIKDLYFRFKGGGFGFDSWQFTANGDSTGSGGASGAGGSPSAGASGSSTSGGTVNAAGANSGAGGTSVGGDGGGGSALAGSSATGGGAEPSGGAIGAGAAAGAAGVGATPPPQAAPGNNAANGCACTLADRGATERPLLSIALVLVGLLRRRKQQRTRAFIEMLQTCCARQRQGSSNTKR
jgi:hypothetical protein